MKKKLYFLPVALSFLLCFLSVLFIIAKNKDEEGIKKYKEDLLPKISNFLIVETRYGRPLWQFGAKDARVNQNTAFLNNITFSIFEPKNSNKEILLDVEAAGGKFFIATKNFQLKKNININFKGTEVKTEELYFDNSDDHIITAKDKVYIVNKNNNIELRGEDMTILPYQGMIKLKNTKSTLLTPPEKYIYINSDKLYFDKKRGVLVFEGNVFVEEVMDKTKILEMKLDRIEILFEKDRGNNMTFTKEDVYMMQGSGNPITVTRKKQNIDIICKKIKYLAKEYVCKGEDCVRINYLDILAFCDEFVYSIKEDKLKLIGNSKIKYKDNIITGEEIVIYPKEEKVEIEGRVKASLILAS